MNTAKTARGPQWGTRRGFTLIELLIVIAVIGVLVGIAIVLGQRVKGGAQDRAAEDTIRVLDAALTEYETATNEPAPSMFEKRVPQLNGAPKVYQYAILDARPDTAGFDLSKDPAVASIVRFTAMGNEATSAQAVLGQINSKFVTQVSVDPNGDVDAKKLAGLQVRDPWGNPIRAVHPSFDGGYGPFKGNVAPGRDQFRTVSEARGKAAPVSINYRRSVQPFDDAQKAANPTWVGDADEGLCANKRMYFYSAGADKDPGTRQDNIYTTRPAFPQETAKY